MKQGTGTAGLFYRLSVPDGRETAPAIVFLHGWSCHGGFFGPQVEAFGEHMRVLVPDLPGHGHTGSAVPLTIEAAADALADLIQELSLRDVLLVGWSMGAHVAYALAERHGTEHIRALVSLDMTPQVLNDATWSCGVRDGLDAAHNAKVLEAIVPHWPQMAERVARRIFASDVTPDPDLLGFARKEILSADPVLLRPMWASLTRQDFRAFLPRLDRPLHLVFGADSALYAPAVADWHRGHVPAAAVHCLEGAGHAPHLEQASEVNRLLRALAGI